MLSYLSFLSYNLGGFLSKYFKEYQWWFLHISWIWAQVEHPHLQNFLVSCALLVNYYHIVFWLWRIGLWDCLSRIILRPVIGLPLNVLYGTLGAWSAMLLKIVTKKQFLKTILKNGFKLFSGTKFCFETQIWKTIFLVILHEGTVHLSIMQKFFIFSIVAQNTL